MDRRSGSCLRHDWHGEENLRAESLPLRRGAYELTAEFVQHTPLFHHAADETHPRPTGFEIKYSGPDTDHKLVTVPHDRFVPHRKGPHARGRRPRGLAGAVPRAALLELAA